MDRVELNTRQLHRFLDEWELAIQAASDDVTAVLKKGAQNVKEDWRAGWAGLSHAPALSRSVTYDFTEKHTVEIGPDKARRQGALGNLIEFGSKNNAPRPAGQQALDAEGPRLEEALADLVIDLVPIAR